MSSEFESLKKLIHEASPDFSDQIKPLTDASQVSSMPLRMRYTLWKYFNRAKYRPVPYNRFAAVSLLNQASAGDKGMRISREMSVHHFNDWPISNNAHPLTAALLLQSELMSNPTLYAVDGAYRYTRFEQGRFLLSATADVPVSGMVLRYCRERQPAEKILSLVRDETGLSRKSALKLLLDMVEVQLLWTSSQTGIIGEQAAQKASPGTGQAEAGNYVLAERKASGIPPEPAKKLLSELTNFLSVHFPAPQSLVLDDFRREFVRKFDLQAVPLSRLMDPQLGIGYGRLARRADQSSPEILKDEMIGPDSGRSLQLTPVVTALLSRFASDRDIDLAGLMPPDPRPAGRLPNTLPVLYRLFGDRFVLDHIGGCTANALLGRFSLCGPGYYHLCRDIAACEAAANPDTDFFDVGYQAEGHTDNINRRLPVYALELPVNSWPQGTALRLEDILVMVRNDELILINRLSGRRLVPRMATAYNFTRSALSVFRFLGDLQYQGLIMPALPDLTSLFPGQAHYSRLSYQSVILFPETWMVPSGLVSGRPDDAQRVRDWLSVQDIRLPFRAGTGDQTLVFDPGNEEDLDMFTEFCRQRRAAETYIAEALTGQGTGVADQYGRAYAAQFLTSVTHAANVYPQAGPENVKMAGEVQRQWIPGGEWLCFEVYGHSSVIADILTLEVIAFLATVKAQLRQWFFIRYEENGPHLRLRLNLNEAKIAGEVISRLRGTLERRIQAGTVRDLKIVTYHRELERYGHPNMVAVERFFHEDSSWVLRLLKRKMSGEQLYAHTLEWMKQMVLLAYAAPAEQLHFARTMAAEFAAEFGWTTAAFRQINRSLPVSAGSVKQVMPAGIRRAWIALDGQLTGAQQKQRMLADLIHLHVNRLFTEDQRRHEAILYQFLFSDRKKQFRFPVS